MFGKQEVLVKNLSDEKFVELLNDFLRDMKRRIEKGLDLEVKSSDYGFVRKQIEVWKNPSKEIVTILGMEESTLELGCAEVHANLNSIISDLYHILEYDEKHIKNSIRVHLEAESLEDCDSIIDKLAYCRILVMYVKGRIG